MRLFIDLLIYFQCLQGINDSCSIWYRAVKWHLVVTRAERFLEGNGDGTDAEHRLLFFLLLTTNLPWSFWMACEQRSVLSRMQTHAAKQGYFHSTEALNHLSQLPTPFLHWFHKGGFRVVGQLQGGMKKTHKSITMHWRCIASVMLLHSFVIVTVCGVMTATTHGAILNSGYYIVFKPWQHDATRRVLLLKSSVWLRLYCTQDVFFCPATDLIEELALHTS